ncbi:hypothetical protein L6452_40527 [Arctium lappa]|uniref:Uncharacterized protein n=1 Tax=Arctium lappa TaxID=4217 RepID=A0ACB8XM64_ARCLA|nr:hypothetical protein L6452_40527 [Arctium lappa]
MFASISTQPLFNKTISALLGTGIRLSREEDYTFHVKKIMASNAGKKDDMDAKKHKDFMEVEDQGPSSMLKRMLEMQECKRTVDERIQKIERRCQCGRMDDQKTTDMLKRTEDMLKRMNDTHDAKFNRLEERVKEVEGFTQRGRLDDIKTWEDMSKRLAEIQDVISRKLEELYSHKGPFGILDYEESSEPLKVLQHKEVQADGDDAVSLKKLNRRKHEEEIQKVEEVKHDQNLIKEPNFES